MGLKKTLIAGALAYLGVKVYQNRQVLAETYAIEKVRLRRMNQDKKNIQKQVTTIKTELAKLNRLSQDTQHHIRVFQNDFKPRQELINDRIHHLQNHLAAKTNTKN